MVVSTFVGVTNVLPSGLSILSILIRSGNSATDGGGVAGVDGAARSCSCA